MANIRGTRRCRFIDYYIVGFCFTIAAETVGGSKGNRKGAIGSISVYRVLLCGCCAIAKVPQPGSRRAG